MTSVSDTTARPGFAARLRGKLKRAPKRLQQAAQRGAERNWVLAQVHQGFVSRELTREAKAVAAGQIRFAQDHRREAASYFQLRRNVHRLEKGLIMRPRRPVFGTEYIGETVKLYCRLRGRSGADTDNAELQWAAGVLRTYFDAVDCDHPKIAPAYQRFSESPPLHSEAAPYKRGLATPPIGFDDFMALCRRRRSVRWYRDAPVPRDLIDQALVAAAQAPSACNRQPFVFRIFDDPAKANEVAAIPMGTGGFSHQLPVVVVIVGRLRAYPGERDRHAIYVDGALAAMSFMFALETLGLASCPINWPDQEPHESRMRAALNLEPDERVVMLVGLGWPDPEGMIPFSAKRPLSELRSYNGT